MGNAGSMTADAMAWLIYVGIVDGCAFEGVDFDKSLADIEQHVDLSHVTLALEALQQYTGENKKK